MLRGVDYIQAQFGESGPEKGVAYHLNPNFLIIKDYPCWSDAHAIMVVIAIEVWVVIDRHCDGGVRHRGPDSACALPAGRRFHREAELRLHLWLGIEPVR